MNYVLITGASRGIGYETAKLFAEKGYKLILVSRKEADLAKAADKIKYRYPTEVLTLPVDLSRPEAAEQIYEFIREHSASVSYLVNNAGFYVKGDFSKTSWENELQLINLQCINHTRLTKLLLPDMLKRKKGGILNVASTGSFIPGPYNAIYCAAKSFVLSFSRALSEETARSGISVTALCPGGTETDFQPHNNRKRSVFFPLMKASEVAKKGFEGLMKGKSTVVPGQANKIQIFFARIMPELSVKLIGKMTRKQIQIKRMNK